MAQKPVSVQLWNTIKLEKAAHRYGLFVGTMLSNENVSFPAGTVVVLGMPKWLLRMGVLVLAIPVVRYDRAADNEVGRESIECRLPTYILASQLPEDVRTSAFKKTPKPPDSKGS